MNLFEFLRKNTYPGRGIILGKSIEGEAVFAYFIMGRSRNSRNRIFETVIDGIKTRAFDESLLTDPSLIIYSPVRVLEKQTIVTNGDQTDTIYEYLSRGESFENALFTREFEPDAPNFTPRISGLLDFKDKLSIKLSILKSDDGDEGQSLRFFYNYENPKAGEGFFIHTYEGDGNPLPSFRGEPRKVDISENIREFSESLWNSLNEDNKISLIVRYIDINTGKYEQIVKNKLEGM